VQQRSVNAATEGSFVFTVTDTGKQFLLDEGFDLKYGARHLKRAIERLLVHPMSNLIASGQIRGGDWIEADHLTGAPAMSFRREAEGVPVRDMTRLVEQPGLTSEMAAAHNARWETGKVQTIRSSRRA
jgi:ATP-dependent Clp protease ATP-binding subunit ClpB